jgi:glycosyltransferase involved in cell wall biosynthesis
VTVVHVVAAGEIGGAERMLVDLARPRTTPGSGERAHVVALFTPNEALRQLFARAGLDVEDRGPVREGPLPYLASSLGPFDVGWLTRVLRRRQAAIVHLHTFASQVLGTRAARRVGARIVRTEHSTRAYDDPTCRPFTRWSLPRADVVVCISEHIRQVVERANRGVRVTTIHNGVDTAHFAPRPGHLERQGRVRFCALGRLEPRKGLDLALEALRTVPEAELALVGDGEIRPDLERHARRLGLGERVRFAGHAVDVRDAIAEADVALSSSREEGLGIALLEAMSMARPVVAVPVGGIPEIVLAGQTGWLAEQRSAPALARAMRQACSDAAERRRRGEAARERVVERFSIEAMRHAYERVYASLSA